MLSVGKADYEELESLSNKIEDELILSPNDLPMLQDTYTYYSTLKTMWLLGRWIEEEKEETLCDEFNVGPGDIYRHVESAQWLLYAAITIAELYHYKKLSFNLENIRQRVHYGIKEELLAMASLRGVGRIRARQLFAHGYHKLTDLKSANENSLASIKTIGKALAHDILEQLRNPLKKRFSAVTTPIEEPAQETAAWTD